VFSVSSPPIGTYACRHIIARHLVPILRTKVTPDSFPIVEKISVAAANRWKRCNHRNDGEKQSHPDSGSGEGATRISLKFKM
jgi:hypothetical protein